MEAEFPGLETPETAQEKLENADSEPNVNRKEQACKDDKPVKKLRSTTRSKVISAKQTLLDHQQSITHVDPPKPPKVQGYACKICEASYTCSTSLKYHMRTKHPNESVESMPIDKAIKQEVNDDFLLTEIKPVVKPIFQCKICNKVFSRKQTLQHHEVTHVDKEFRRQDYRCKICGAGFSSQTGVKYHLSTKHGSGRRKRPCPTCGQIFRSVVGLRDHTVAKHGDGPVLKCEKCPMVFARKRQLTLHMAKHGCGPFGLHVCTLCGKPYARASDLAKHEVLCAFRGPDQPKVFRCGQCPEVFAIRALLRIHERTTHGEILGAKKKGSAKKTTVRLKKRKRPTMEQEGCREIVKEEDPLESSVFYEGEENAAEELSSDVNSPVESMAFCETQNFESPLLEEVKAEPEEAEENITNGPVETIALCETPFVKEEFDQIESNEVDIKEETIEFGEYQFADFENDCSDDRTDEIKTEDEDQPENETAEDGSKESSIPNRNPAMETLSQDYHCDQEIIHGLGKEPTKSSSNVRSCKHCKKTFNEFRCLVDHLKNIHGEIIDKSKLDRCTSCRTYFIYAEEMEQHVCLKISPVVGMERPFKCDLCGKGFSTKNLMQKHFSSHTEYQNVKCDQCPKAFFDENQLNCHKVIKHKPIEACVKCNICNKLLASQENLKQHLKFHAADRVTCSCEICGRQYESRKALMQHIYLNHNTSIPKAEPNPCPKCGEMYNSKKSLAAHVKTHDLPIKCTFCEKRFAANYQRRAHEQQSHAMD